MKLLFLFSSLITVFNVVLSFTWTRLHCLYVWYWWNLEQGTNISMRMFKAWSWAGILLVCPILSVNFGNTINLNGIKDLVPLNQLLEFQPSVLCFLGFLFFLVYIHKRLAKAWGPMQGRLFCCRNINTGIRETKAARGIIFLTQNARLVGLRARETLACCILYKSHKDYKNTEFKSFIYNRVQCGSKVISVLREIQKH